MFSPTTDTIGWSTNTGERMRLTSVGNLVIAASGAGDGYALPGNSRSLTITGVGAAAATSRGVLALVNNRTTASALNDIAGEILFLSKNNGSAPSDGSRLVADISTRLTGTGGTNGFGGQLEFYVKGDNATALTLGMVINSTAEVVAYNGVRLDDDVANGGATALNYYREATHATTFTSNGTGGGTSSSVTLRITRVGRVVTVFIPAFSVSSGTGASAINSNTDLPSWAFPNATASTINQNAVQGGTTSTESLWTRVNTGGDVFFNIRGGGTTFTNSVTIDMVDQYITYTV
jgi:hypothetical protein